VRADFRVLPFPRPFADIGPRKLKLWQRDIWQRAAQHVEATRYRSSPTISTSSISTRSTSSTRCEPTPSQQSNG
jgi:hypothetical protein